MTPDEHTVLILDDDPHIRSSLETLLTAHGYRIRSHAEPDDFFRTGPPLGSACLLLDQQLGYGVTGVQVHQKMMECGWDLPTIFLTAHWDVQLVVNAMRKGADDFLAKPFDPAELVKAVERALRGAGDRFHDRQIITEARRRMASLTKRERQIVGMVTAGLLNKEIAGQLNLAVVTVKLHRSRAMRKTGAGNPAELARIVTLAAMVD